MKLYKLNPNLWPKNRDKVLRINLLSYVVGGFAGVFMVNPSLFRHPSLLPMVLGAMLPFLVVITAVFGYMTFRKLKQSKKRYDSFELRMDDERIERHQFSMPSLSLQRSEIVGVQAVVGKGFMVKTADHVKFLYIPDELIGYEDVCSVLKSWAPEEGSTDKMPWLFRPSLGVFVPVGSLLAIYLLANRVAVTSIAVTFVGFLVYVALYTIRSPHSTPQAKRALWSFAWCTLLVVWRVMAVWR